MKPKLLPDPQEGHTPSDSATEILMPAVMPEAFSNSADSKQFRRLKAHELVSRGDYVVDDQHAFKPWDGPTGFRADAFIKAIYRRDTTGAVTSRGLK